MSSATRIKVEYYRASNTNTIHMVGEFPSPRTDGHTQCGQPVEGMNVLSRSEVLRAKDYEFCLKCSGLLGLR